MLDIDEIILKITDKYEFEDFLEIILSYDEFAIPLLDLAEIDYDQEEAFK